MHIANPKRIEAKQNGEKFYLLNVPCKHGHLSKRYTCNARCITCEQSRDRKTYKVDRTRAKQGQYRDINRMLIRQKQRMAYLKKLTSPNGDTQWLLRAKAIKFALRRLLKSSNPDLSRLQKLGLIL